MTPELAIALSMLISPIVPISTATSSRDIELITMSKADLYRIAETAATQAERYRERERACLSELTIERRAHASDLREALGATPSAPISSNDPDGVPALIYVWAIVSTCVAIGSLIVIAAY